MLTAKRLRQVLKYNPGTGVFTWVEPGPKRVLGARAGSSEGVGRYRQITVDGEKYREHRLAWLYVTGRWPIEVDHKNRNKADNRWDNLREVTHKQNGENAGVRKDNTSGVPGVYRQKNGRWQAYLSTGGKRIHLGRFNAKKLAVAARFRAEETHFTHRHGT